MIKSTVGWLTVGESGKIGMNRNLDDSHYKMLGLFSTWRLLFKICFKQKGERMSPRDHMCFGARFKTYLLRGCFFGR